MPNAILAFLVRFLLLAAGLVFAASLLLTGVVLFAAWLLRAGWARLTGRPVKPFIVRFGGKSFEDLVRRAGATPGSRTPRADAAQPGLHRLRDVTDVEPR